MSIRSTLFIVGLSVLLASCSTSGSYTGSNGQKTSTTDMGVSYLLGRGVPQSDTKAFAYFSQAANNEDNPFAQNELAYMYAAGKGTTRDQGKAFYYYQKAANHGLASAQYNLGLMYQYGLGTPRNGALAKEWIQKSAAHGFEPAKTALARI